MLKYFKLIMSITNSMKLIPFFIILIFVGMVNNTFAVEDNVVIEGNQSPGLYSTELYKIIAEPSDNPRTVELSVYGPIGKIASQKATFDRGGTFVQFFVKFNPPLYKVDEKYTMEISGDGLIGRMNFDLQPAPGGLEKLNERDEVNSSSQPSINFRTLNEIQKYTTEFDSYDQLIISGIINNFDSNFRFIQIDIIDPKNKITRVTPLVVSDSGTFEKEFDLSRPLWENPGKYQILVSHMNNEFGEDIVITSSEYIQINSIIAPQVPAPQVPAPQIEPNFDIIPIAIIIFIFILIIAFLEKLRRRNNKKNIVSATSTAQTPSTYSQVPSTSTTRRVTRPVTRQVTRPVTRPVTRRGKNNPSVIPTANKIQSWRNYKASWPRNTDFSSALQNPSACFSTKKDFSTGKIVNSKAGFPMARSGSFAIVFKFKIGNKTHALKCFTSPPHGFENQVRISRYLKSKKLDFTVTYDTDVEIIVAIAANSTQISCPMLVTPWIEGKILQDYLEQDNLKQVSEIAKEFFEMISKLEQFKIAHGDLQSKNIIVQKDLSLKLIDYDGMFIPELRNQPSKEDGTLHYQHPLRLKDVKKGGISVYDETMDRFSSIVIYLSLLVLSAKPNLYKKYHDDENIIFKNKDFESPDKSELFKEVSKIHNSDIKKLNVELIKYCKSKQLSKIKTVKEILM